jgi:NitT/TauT family transport system substrate-binding protein
MTFALDRRSFLAGSATSLTTFFMCQSGAAATSTSFLLDVLPNPKHALFYPAVARGYFQKAALDVHIESGKGSADVVQKIASGAFTFGFADASALILGRSRGLPVKLVAMVHYKPLMTIITRKEARVEKPADLAGKKIASTSGDAVRAVFPAIARLNQSDPPKVEFVTVDQAAKSALLIAGQVDGVCDYVSAFPVYEAAAAKNGIQLNRLLFADFGLDIYSNGIIAEDASIQKNPALVRDFTSSILESLRYAVDNRDESVAIFRQFYPQYDSQITHEGLDIAVRHLMVPEVQEKGLGRMSDGKMASTIETTRATFGLQNAVAPGDVYTNAFCEA